MVKLVTLPGDSSLIMATSAEESTPPLKNTPSGTSLTRREVAASHSFS